MTEPKQRDRFECLMLPHLDAAYTLALWLMRDEEEARDAVQEAFLRALRFFGSFRGDDGRPWLLRIVRNACYELHGRGQGQAGAEVFDDDAVGAESVAPGAVFVLPVNPETAAIERSSRELVWRCLRGLPPDFREVLVLRELHDCSYKEIAMVAGIPMGTVMSRLARARRLLQARIAAVAQLEDTGS